MGKTRIKDIFKTSSGCTPTSSNLAFYDSNDYRWLNSSEVAGRIYDTKKYISEKAFKKYTALKVYPKDTVVIAMYGATVGEIGILKVDSTTNQAVCAILPNYEIANPDYFYYKMLNEKQNLIGLASGSARTNISQQIIADYETVIPIMAEQNKIADVLCAIDDLIEVNSNIIETSERLMREIYDYWFVQFDFPDENSRPYKSSGGEMIYDEKLKREIPRGWRIFNIEDLASSVWGQCPDGINILDKDERGDDVLPYCSGAGDMDGGYIVNCQATTNASRREVGKGAILISVAGTIGKMAIANERISLGRATLGLMPKDKEHSALVWLLLKSFNHRLQTASVGAVQKIINKSNLEEINIALPEKMLDINMLNNTMSLIYELSIENKKLNSLRDWLLPMLMNGQVKIAD